MNRTKHCPASHILTNRFFSTHVNQLQQIKIIMVSRVFIVVAMMALATSQVGAAPTKKPLPKPPTKKPLPKPPTKKPLPKPPTKKPLPKPPTKKPLPKPPTKKPLPKP